jgi:hypothetical protein
VERSTCFTRNPSQILSYATTPLQAAAKRFKVTGSGKVVARHAGKQV